MTDLLKRLFGRIFYNTYEIRDASVTLRTEARASSTSNLLHGSSIRYDIGNESRKYVVIGNKGLINARFIFESLRGEAVIGNNVRIGGATFISRNSTIVDNDVTMAWDITLYDHDPRSTHWEYRQNDNNQCYTDYFANGGNNVFNKDWSNVVSK